MRSQCDAQSGLALVVIDCKSLRLQRFIGRVFNKPAVLELASPSVTLHLALFELERFRQCGITDTPTQL